MGTITYTGKLVMTSCWCGVHLAIPDDLYDIAQRNGTAVYCPLGHQFVYGDTEQKRLKARVAELEQSVKYARAARDAARDQAAAAERSKIALKGHLTRARNKIATGTCPVPDCGLHFSNVREHMKFKHPDWHLTDPETGKAAEL